jgi:hypothetical protein
MNCIGRHRGQLSFTPVLEIEDLFKEINSNCPIDKVYAIIEGVDGYSLKEIGEVVMSFRALGEEVETVSLSPSVTAQNPVVLPKPSQAPPPIPSNPVEKGPNLPQVAISKPKPPRGKDGLLKRAYKSISDMRCEAKSIPAPPGTNASDADLFNRE